MRVAAAGLTSSSRPASTACAWSRLRSGRSRRSTSRRCAGPRWRPRRRARGRAVDRCPPRGDDPEDSRPPLARDHRELQRRVDGANRPDRTRRRTEWMDGVRPSSSPLGYRDRDADLRAGLLYRLGLLVGLLAALALIVVLALPSRHGTGDTAGAGSAGAWWRSGHPWSLGCSSGRASGSVSTGAVWLLALAAQRVSGWSRGARAVRIVGLGGLGVALALQAVFPWPGRVYIGTAYDLMMVIGPSLALGALSVVGGDERWARRRIGFSKEAPTDSRDRDRAARSSAARGSRSRRRTPRAPARRPAR